MTEPLPPEEPQVPAKTNERAGWLASIETGGAKLPDAWDPTGLASAYQIAALLARSQVVPKALQGRPEDLFVILWSGKELGLSAMTALRHLPVVHGRATMSAELMRARALGHPDCEYFDVVESDTQHAVVEWVRKGRPARQASFTIEEARMAGLVKPDSGWQKYPADMLVARATSRGVRRGFPEVLGPTSYTPEEALEMEQEEGGRWAAAQPEGAAERAAAAIVGKNRPRQVVEVIREAVAGVAEDLERDARAQLTAPSIPPPYEPLGAPPATTAFGSPIPLPPSPAVPLSPADPTPKPWQPVLDLKLPRVGDTIASRLFASGLTTHERILEAGRFELEKIPGISAISAQAIILACEKALGGEPPPAAPEEANSPPIGIPFPGQEPNLPRGYTPPAYDPPAPTKQEMQPITPNERYALERHAIRTKRGGLPSGQEGDQAALAELNAFVEETFDKRLAELPRYFFRAVMRWAEAEGLKPEIEEINVLRQRGYTK